MSKMPACPNYSPTNTKSEGLNQSPKPLIPPSQSPTYQSTTFNSPYQIHCKPTLDLIPPAPWHIQILGAKKAHDLTPNGQYNPPTNTTTYCKIQKPIRLTFNTMNPKIPQPKSLRNLHLKQRSVHVMWDHVRSGVLCGCE